MGDKKHSRIFITGANGFVGANILRHVIKQHYDVHILHQRESLGWRIEELRNHITIHKGSITNFSALKKIITTIQPDYIIHLATFGAYAHQQDLDKIVSVNINGIKNLLEASKEVHYKAFINTGSSSEYGFKSDPMKETDFCDPVSFYAVTKLGQTNLCKVFAKTYNKPIITLRLFSVYGQFEEPTRFIPTIINSLIHKVPIQITPGNQRRDFIHVDDVVIAFMKALRKAEEYKGEIFNVGSGKEMTNDEIVKTLFSVTKKETEIDKGGYPKRMWDTAHWVADISKSQNLLKWKPTFQIEEGLKNTYSWIQKNIQYYQ